MNADFFVKAGHKNLRYVALRSESTLQRVSASEARR